MTDTQVPGAQTPGAEQPPEQPRSVVGLVLLVAGIVALGVLGSVSAVIVVLALLVMIFMHELGHYLTARSAGMKVTEFFLGFGPRIWSFRKGETEYGLKAIPAGAYVRIIGMHNLDPVEPEDEARAYKNKPYWRKMSVASAGSMMHFLMAALLLFALFATYGQRSERQLDGRIALAARRHETSPAIEAGLEVGDRIVAVDGIPVTTFDATVDLIQARPGPAGGARWSSVTARPSRPTTTLKEHNPEGEPVGFLGVGPTIPTRASRSCPPRQNTGVMFKDAHDRDDRGARLVLLAERAVRLRRHPAGTARRRRLDTGSSSDEESQGDRPLSPVGAVRLASQAADAGLPELLWFLVVINMFVGIFNLIPLLPLDGGHIAIGTYEKIRSRKGKRYEVDVAKLMPLTYAVVLFMGFVFVSSLWLDLSDPLRNPFGQ